jgi:hypothetical protein
LNLSNLLVSLVESVVCMAVATSVTRVSVISLDLVSLGVTGAFGKIKAELLELDGSPDVNGKLLIER